MILQTTWFYLWGVLWAIFFMTAGFDFGVGGLYPFLGKDDHDKRKMLNSIGPSWNGNEVWLITAGGVTFAAFPKVYAIMFSSLYAPLMLILFALILRGVAIEFRNQLNNSKWLFAWDMSFFLGSILPALLFGVAFANIFKGIPIDDKGQFHGTILTLLNVYGLAGGIFFVIFFLSHGSLWLCLKTEGELQNRSIKTANILWNFVLLSAVIFLILSKTKTHLFNNYFANPSAFIFILIPVASILGIKIFLSKQNYFYAVISSSTAIASTVLFGIIGLYPNLFPSSLNNLYSLTAINASSSQLTLKIMLIVALIFVPVVIAYQIWTYNLFKGKATSSKEY